MCATTRSVLQIYGSVSSSLEWTKSCFSLWVSPRSTSTTQTKRSEVTRTSAMIWASFPGTSGNFPSRMDRSHARLLFHSKTLEGFKLTGSSRCQTTQRFIWKLGLTLALLPQSRLLRRIFSIKKSSRLSQERDLWHLVSRWIWMCFTTLKKSASIISESSSKSWTANQYPSSLKVKHSIDALSFSWSSTHTIFLRYRLVLSGPSPIL